MTKTPWLRRVDLDVLENHRDKLQERLRDLEEQLDEVCWELARRVAPWPWPRTPTAEDKLRNAFLDLMLDASSILDAKDDTVKVRLQWQQ